MFDKLKFWKKDDPFDSYTSPFGNDEHTDQRDPFATTNTSHPFEQQNQSSQQQPFDQFGQQQTFTPHQIAQAQPAPQQESTSGYGQSLGQRDVELILSKLETIKVSLDNLAHRVEHLERKSEQPKQNTW